MPVKDLYYQKYLKYKNKYLNLCNQVGGGGYSIDIKDKTITIDYTEETSDFSVEKLNNPIITTIKLKNVMNYYNSIFPKLEEASLFTHITTLIFDDNDLSEIFIVDFILNLIDLFTNVSNFSFEKCSLTEKTAKYLYDQLLNLRRQITNINVKNNNLPEEMVEKFKNINDKKLSKQTEYSDKHTPPPHIFSSTDGDGYIIDS